MASQAQHEPPLAELGAGPTPTSDLESIYTALQAYPFDTDNEYLSGLASILGHPSTPPTAEELTSNPDLILQVRCFYFARKHGLPAIDPSAYSQWLASSPRPGAQNTADATISQSSTASTILPQSSISAPSREQGPPYPTSFAEIVDLITRNVPVPGIEEIPDTVLEHGSSKVDHTPRRKKPWENDGEDVSAAIPATAALPAGFPDAQPQPIAAKQSTPAEGAQVAPEDSAEATSSADMLSSATEGTSVNGHLTTGEGVVKILQPNAIPDSGLLAKD